MSALSELFLLTLFLKDSIFLSDPKQLTTFSELKQCCLIPVHTILQRAARPSGTLIVAFFSDKPYFALSKKSLEYMSPGIEYDKIHGLLAFISTTMLFSFDLNGKVCMTEVCYIRFD